MSDKKQIPVYERTLSFGGGVDEYDITYLTLEDQWQGKLVGYLLPTQETE